MKDIIDGIPCLDPQCKNDVWRKASEKSSFDYSCVKCGFAVKIEEKNGKYEIKPIEGQK